MKDEIVYFDAWWNEQCKGKREDFPCKKIAFKAWKSGPNVQLTGKGDGMTVDELVMKIRDNFEQAISAKTGWGKNEILKQLDLAIANAALGELKHHIKD